MRRFLLLLLAVALVAPACSAFGTAPAATVDGHEISVSSIDDELQIIKANKQYRTALENNYGAFTDSTDKAAQGAFNTAFVAQLLNFRIWYTKIDADLKDRGIKITAKVLDAVTETIKSSLQSLDTDPNDAEPSPYDTFPKAYLKRLIHQEALIETVQNELIAKVGDDPKAFYENNKERFAEICVSHALVGLQNGRTAEEAQTRAQSLYDAIQSGDKTFEEVATDDSDDTAAAAGGGELGCGSQLTLQFDPTFEKAAFALEKGVVSEPVQTQFGSHLILVTKRTIPSYSKVKDTVDQVMTEARGDFGREYLVRVLCGGTVDVNPRYGRWTNETCDGLTPLPPSVVPPEGPIGATTTTTAFIGG